MFLKVRILSSKLFGQMQSDQSEIVQNVLNLKSKVANKVKKNSVVKDDVDIALLDCLICFRS